MFSKFKQKKAPLSLSVVSNAIKLSGGNQDLSPASINGKNISVSTGFQLGLPKDSIIAVAHDPVQSLLAVSTNTNEVRVFGQFAVEVVFGFTSTAPITKLHFIKGVYLVAIAESVGNVTVLSLHSKTILATYSVPGAATASDSNYSLDWLLIGLQNGQVHIYDVDRLNQTPFRIDNLQKRIMPKVKMSPVNSILYNPRDIGTVLITYSHSTIIYSMISGEIKQTLVYQLDKAAKGFELANFIVHGGKKKLFGGSAKEVIPEVIKAQWHPNGLHVATLHQDGSIVFWDAGSGTILEARNLFVSGLHKPGQSIDPETNPFAPITDIRWVCAEDPEITQLLVSGGDVNKHNAITVLDFGYTLKYSLTSYEKQAEFYSSPPSGQRRLEFIFNDSKGHDQEQEVITKINPIAAPDLCYFNGNHDPKLLLLQSNFGSIYLIAYSATGNKLPDIGDTLLPPSISMILPPVSYLHVELLQRIQWYNIIASGPSSSISSKINLLLNGGAPVQPAGAPKPIGAEHEGRTILITGHEGGIIRLADISKGDNRAPESIVKINLKGVLYDRNNPLSIKIKFVSVSFESREMLVALANGEVVICKFGKMKPSQRGEDLSKVDYKSCGIQHANDDAKLIDLFERAINLSISSTTFIPTSLLQLEVAENIACIKMSNVGFAAIAYKSGRLIVCDITRGPAIIFNCKDIKEYLVSVTGKCFATTLEFSIQEYAQEGFSSILLIVGTNCGGNLITFKIIPMQNGGFEVLFGNKTIGLNYRVLGKEDPEKSKLVQIIPINSVNGNSSKSSLEMFRKLSQGVVIPSYTIVTSPRDIRVIQLPKTKLSHKVIDETCLSCGVVNYKNEGIVLAILTKSGFIKFCSIPALKDIADMKIPKEVYSIVEKSLNSGIAADSDILLSGSAFIRTGFSEFINLTIYDKDSRNKSKDDTTDLLFNENAIIPPRPVASTLLWAKGQSHYVSSNDLAELIAGPNRKPAKHPESALAYNISPEANPNQAYGSNKFGSDTKTKSYKDPVRKSNKPGSRGIEAQGFMGNLQRSLVYVEETFNGYANQVSETVTESVESQKKDFYTSALKSKVGF